MLNPGPDLYIVRTVTVFYGGLGIDDFGLNDENGVGMLQATLGPATSPSQVWNELRLVWPAGATWTLSTNLGTDMTGHGYQLTPP